jgi:hypothetical protein
MKTIRTAYRLGIIINIMLEVESPFRPLMRIARGEQKKVEQARETP